MNYKIAGVITPEKPIGRLWIVQGPTHGVVIYCYKKPKLIHRYFMKLLLGFVWEDWKDIDV